MTNIHMLKRKSIIASKNINELRKKAQDQQEILATDLTEEELWLKTG